MPKSRETGELRIFLPITKIDEENRIVYGSATFEDVDSADEIWDYASSKPYFEQWSAEAHKVSGGKSHGNLRSMHGPIAAGKLTQLVLDDATKSCDIAAKVVDDGEWNKVLEGVYTGFSQGGKYVRRWKDPSDPTKTRFTSKPVEISLVDLPCLPGATFEIIKADGSTELRKHRTESNTMYVPTNEEVAARAAELATKAADGSLWTDHLEKARAELVTEDVQKDGGASDAPAEGAAPAPAADGSTDAVDAVEGDAEKAKKPEPVVDDGAEDSETDPKDKKEKTKEEDAEKARLAAADSLTQVWLAPDGTHHARKADAINHIVGTPPASPVAAALKAARGAGEAEPAYKFEPTPGLETMAETLGHVWKGLEGEVVLKGMYTVGRLAELIDSACSIQRSCCWEAEAEGDDSPIPQKLGEAISSLGSTLIAMAEEEVGEMIAEINSRGANVETIVASFEWAAAAEMVKSIAANGELMEKAGRRNSSNDQKLIQAAHDSIVKAGAVCDTDAGKAAEGDDLAKRAESDPVIKGLLEERDLLKTQVAEAVVGIGELGEDLRKMRADMEALRNTPVPMAPRTSAVNKGDGVEDVKPEDAVAKSLAMIEEMKKTQEGRNILADAAIRLAQQNGRAA